MTSAVMITTERDAANAFGEMMGWGPGSFSVPLSPTGVEPATHWGCRAEVMPGFIDLLADPPPEALPVLAVTQIDLRETGDPHQHWTDVLASASLVTINEINE